MARTSVPTSATGARRSRRPAGAGWNAWRAVVGTGYNVAAVFNLLVTLPSGNLSWFARSAWFPVLGDLVDGLTGPSFGVFRLTLVAFELGVGTLILGRGRLVDLGVGASVLWVLALLPFLPPVPMGATNLVLATLQGALLARRYDRSIWELTLSALGRRPASHPRIRGDGQPPAHQPWPARARGHPSRLPGGRGR